MTWIEGTSAVGGSRMRLGMSAPWDMLRTSVGCSDGYGR